ncbi:MAG: hypothetical protein PUB10_10405 [Clostridiales bacterium]|nr:hypothetical protein [Clostridiales bacterium]
MEKIREISDKIWLCNGEDLPYVVGNKRRFMKRIVDEKKKMAEHHAGEDIRSAFGDLFYNMDFKWLESYERAAQVICFQTFVGHCGCIIFNVDEMK